DGLSEATFLLFAATALLFGVMAFQKPSMIRYVLCGFFGALAYLTRPEGALILLAAAMVWLGIQAFRAWRRPWREWLIDGGLMAVTALLVASPYCVAIGGVTNKPTPGLMFKTAGLSREPAGEPSHLEPEIAPAALSRMDRKGGA